MLYILLNIIKFYKIILSIHKIILSIHPLIDENMLKNALFMEKKYVYMYTL